MFYLVIGSLISALSSLPYPHGVHRRPDITHALNKTLSISKNKSSAPKKQYPAEKNCKARGGAFHGQVRAAGGNVWRYTIRD